MEQDKITVDKRILLTENESEFVSKNISNLMQNESYLMLTRVLEGVPDGYTNPRIGLDYHGGCSPSVSVVVFRDENKNFYGDELPIQVQKGDKVVLCEDWDEEHPYIEYRADGLERPLWRGWEPASDMDPADARWEAVVKDVWVERKHPVCMECNLMETCIPDECRYITWEQVVKLEVRRRE